MPEEEIIAANPLHGAQRLLSVILSTRDRAIVLTLLKTGIRLNELRDLDLADIDLGKGVIKLKESPKITNRVRFMDDELIAAI